MRVQLPNNFSKTLMEIKYTNLTKDFYYVTKKNSIIAYRKKK